MLSQEGAVPLGSVQVSGGLRVLETSLRVWLNVRTLLRVWLNVRSVWNTSRSWGPVESSEKKLLTCSTANLTGTFVQSKPDDWF